MVEKDQHTQLIVTAVRVIAILLVLIIVSFALYGLIIGAEATVQMAVSEGEQIVPIIETGRYRYWPGILYLVTAVLLLIGLFNLKRLRLAWLGWGLLLVTSLLLLFSSGAAFIPITAVLFVLMLVIQQWQPKRREAL